MHYELGRMRKKAIVAYFKVPRCKVSPPKGQFKKSLDPKQNEPGNEKVKGHTKHFCVQKIQLEKFENNRY
jgi:hypothetical protein